MTIILRKQPVNEAAALILDHSVVTPTGSRLGVLSMDVHERKRRLFIDICLVRQLPAVLMSDGRYSIAACTATSTCAFVSHLIYTFKSHYGGCCEYVEGCANICRARTLNWLMTLDTELAPVSSPAVKDPRCLLQFTFPPGEVALYHWVEHTGVFGLCFFFFC